MFEKIRKDIEAYQRSTGGTRIRQRMRTYRTPGIKAVMVYRFGNWLNGQSIIVRLLLEPVYFVLYHRMRTIWGIQILRRAKIGPGFIVQHHGGVFVDGDVVIGEYCEIHQDVTLGVIREGPRKGAPQIGDNVKIAPGAKLVGKIRIGSNVRIGPNAVVMKNIPDGSIVSLPSVQVVRFPMGFGKRTDGQSGSSSQ